MGFRSARGVAVIGARSCGLGIVPKNGVMFCIVLWGRNIMKALWVLGLRVLFI